MAPRSLAPRSERVPPGENDSPGGQSIQGENDSLPFLPAGRTRSMRLAGTKIALRFCVCVCVHQQLTCAKLRHSITMSL